MTQDAAQGASARIGRNFLLLVVARFALLGMTLVQLAIVFRALGVEGTGQFGFALSYTMLFNVFATFGIQRLLVRDIARNPAIAWAYVWTSSAVVLVLGVAVSALVSGSVFFMDAPPVLRNAVIFAALSSILIWAIQAPFESLLTARERMGYIAVAYLVAGVLRIGAVYAVVKWSPTSAAVHAALAGANAVGLLLCILFAIRVAGWERPRIRLALAFQQMRECFPFFIAVVCSQIYFRSDVSILKWMAGETAVGLYTPAQRIIEPLMMIAGIWGTAVFPALCRFSTDSPEKYARLKASSIRLALLVAFPMAVGLACLARPIIHLLAGPEFDQSVILLQLMAVITPLFYLNAIGQEAFYASHRNWFVVTAYALAAVTNVTLNVLLIPRLGTLAVPIAAITANLLITIMFVAALKSEWGSMALFTLLAKTTAACAIMAAAVHATSRASIMLAVAVGTIVYTGGQWLAKTLNADECLLLTNVAKPCALFFATFFSREKKVERS